MQEMPEIEKATFAAERDEQIVFSDPDKPYSLRIKECDTAFIRFFSIELLVGTEHAINRTNNSIVLFENAAKKLDTNIQSLIGKTVQTADKIYVITGIAKNPENSFMMRDDGLLVNSESGYFRYGIYEKWDPSILRSFVMIKKGVSIKAFRERLSKTRYVFELIESRLGTNVNPDGSFQKEVAGVEDERFKLEPLNNPFKFRSVGYYVNIFLIGLLILLTTMFNFISFQTAQFYNRLKECALRRIAGAGKRHIFGLFYIEIAIAFLFTYLASLFLLTAFEVPLKGVSWLSSLDTDMLKFKMLQYLFFVMLLTFLLYLIPVSVIYKASVYSTFFGGIGKIRKGFGRAVLLFLQLVILYLFISAFLIVGFQTVSFRAQIFGHLSKEDKMNIISTGFHNKEAIDNREEIISRISSSPFVNDILIQNGGRILESGGHIVLTSKDDSKNNKHFDIPMYNENSIGVRYVYPHFFDFFQCVLITGTFFDENSSPDDVVVDETFASYYPDKNPVGESFNGYKIVGVIKNLNMEKNKDGIVQIKQPMFYKASNQPKGYLALYVKAHSGKTKEVRDVIDRSMSGFSTLYTFTSNDIYSFGEEIENYLSIENKLFDSMSVLFVVSFIICLLGIYSAVVTNTEKRRKEIGIRKINGATLKDILLLFGKTYMGLCTLACIAAFPVVFYYGNQWLDNYIERISLNIQFFMAIYITITVFIALTILFQILKVARENPVEVIKS
jgi:ABC-type antimicrobial peptide transport system permease subunit